MRFASWAGVGGWEELVGLFTFGTLEFNGRWGYLHLYSHVCYLQLWVYLQELAMGHVQREKRVRCGDWRMNVDLVLPGVSVGVVGDMRHVESVKSRTIA